MTNEELRQPIMDAKYARIISCISKMYNVTLEKAMDLFYSSDTATLIDEGVADLQCRSDKYLASEIWREHCEV